MNLLEMSDDQIMVLAKPILIDTIVGARNKDWALFSKHMPAEDAANMEAKEDVESQWEEDEYLTTFSEDAEFLAVIRKSDCVLVLWRLKSTVTEDEYLEKLYLEVQNGELFQVGIWTE